MNSCRSNFEETSIKMDHQHLCYCFGPMIWQPHERPHCNSVVNMGNSSHDSNFSYGSDLAKTDPNSWRFGIPWLQVRTIKQDVNKLPEIIHFWALANQTPNLRGLYPQRIDKSTVWPCIERTSTLRGFGHLRVVLHRPLHGWIFRRGQVLKGIEAHRSWHSDEVHVAVGFKFKICWLVHTSFYHNINSVCFEVVYRIPTMCHW